MNIDEILEMMDELLDKSMGVPFSGKKSVVDVESMRDLINEVRLNLPQEIKQAKLIVSDRTIILNDAKKEAESIVRKAEERAKILVSNEEITRQATQKGQEILNCATSKAKEIRNATNEYIDNIMNQTEELLSTSLVDLKKTRQAIRNTSKKR